MSNEEFRDRIKAICGPAPVTEKPIVRQPSDRGYLNVCEASNEGCFCRYEKDKAKRCKNHLPTTQQPEEAA